MDALPSAFINQEPDKLPRTLRSASLATMQQSASEHKMLNTEGRGSSATESRIPFAKLCYFEPDQDKVPLFSCTNYKTYVHVCIQLREKTQLKYIIETGADQNSAPYYLLYSS